MDHLTKLDAKARGLPGSDTVRDGHHLYVDTINREAGVAELYQKALQLFADSIKYKYRRELRSEQIAWATYQSLAVKPHGLFYPMPYFRRYVENAFLDDLKIGAGLELIAKGRLLDSGHILHLIDRQNPPYRDLARLQATQPIKIDDLLQIDGYRYNGTDCYLPGLLRKSVLFSTMIQKSRYSNLLQTDPLSINLIDYYRIVRNEVHLPALLGDYPAPETLPADTSQALFSVFNESIRRANEITTAHKLNWPIVEIISDQ